MAASVATVRAEAAAPARPARRESEEGARTREAILDATESILVEEGYSAVTSRRVAEKAGLKSQLVHYYFGTMDDLLVALYERTESMFLERHLQAATADNPLRALWELSIHPQRVRLSQEFIALSHHRKAMRKITARVLDQMHSINTAFITKYLHAAGLDPQEFPPLLISHVINGLSRSLINEEAMGVTRGHDEILAYAERWLARIEAKQRVAIG